MDLTETIKKALRAIDEANVPDDLREKAFEKAFDLAAQAVDS